MESPHSVYACIEAAGLLGKIRLDQGLTHKGACDQLLGQNDISHRSLET